MSIDFYKKTITITVNRKRRGSGERYSEKIKDNSIHLLYLNEAVNCHKTLSESDEWEQLAKKHPDLLCINSNIFTKSKHLRLRGLINDSSPIYFTNISSICYDVKFEKYRNVKYGALKNYPADRVVEYIKEQWERHNVGKKDC